MFKKDQATLYKIIKLKLFQKNIPILKLKCGKVREHLILKKNVFFRALPEWGGGGLARIKKIHFIYSSMMAEKAVQGPRKKGGERGNSGNARKKTFIFIWGLP